MQDMDQDGRRSPGSTIAASEMDEHMTAPSSPSRPDPRASLRHVLGESISRQTTPLFSRNGNPDDMTEDDTEIAHVGTKAGKNPSGKGRGKAGQPTTSDNSIYTGNKVKHLKKPDGEPLWRKDIQYDFLKLVFDDDKKVFTNSYEPDNISKQSFSDLYIDAMARSSKTSKILRDKLLSDNEPARNMAMVCLLVNLGRMNTTLNFFPEMRAQLRTYHPIPSLQAQQDPNSYKQLQDAPRLKSILKGASEDRPEPNSLDKIKNLLVPRTNPVNLIFVLAQYAPKITDLHFPPPRDFYDLIMRPTITSKSRARAFLWLMWFYLESDFTEEGADENPFGAGVDYGQNLRNQGVPRLVFMGEAETEEENVDTPEEIEFGQAKQKERARIIEADKAAIDAEHGPTKRGPKPKLNLLPDESVSPATLLSKSRPSKYESDIDSTRSTPPPRAVPNMRIQSVLNGPKARGGAPIKHPIIDSSSPAPSGFSHVILADGGSTRRSRPLTAHQLAVEHNRNQRINYILSRGLRKKHHEAKKIRKMEGALFRAGRRLESMPDPFEDSEGEESQSKAPGPFRARGFGGLVPLSASEDDFGEEIAAFAGAFRRIGRRLDRWDGHKGIDLGVMASTRVQEPPPANGADGGETEDEKAIAGGEAEEEDLDDMDKEILGLVSENENENEDEEDLDDVEKALLGLRGDETEEELSDGGMELD